MKIHPHLQMVDLHGYHVVDKQDEGVVVDQWNIGQNQMINGIIMMIDLVDRRKKNFFLFKIFYFSSGKKGPSNSYESNQQRGWRSNATMSDRDLNLRRPQTKRDRKIFFFK